MHCKQLYLHLYIHVCTVYTLYTVHNVYIYTILYIYIFWLSQKLTFLLAEVSWHVTSLHKQLGSLFWFRSSKNTRPISALLHHSSMTTLLPFRCSTTQDENARKWQVEPRDSLLTPVQQLETRPCVTKYGKSPHKSCENLVFMCLSNMS